MMVAKGFGEMDKKKDKRFENLEQQIEILKDRVKNLEYGQEEIMLRLTNLAYRFELAELEKRVRVLERKAK